MLSLIKGDSKLYYYISNFTFKLISMLKCKAFLFPLNIRVLPEGFSSGQVHYGFGENKKQQWNALGVKEFTSGFILMVVG